MGLASRYYRKRTQCVSAALPLSSWFPSAPAAAPVRYSCHLLPRRGFTIWAMGMGYSRTVPALMPSGRGYCIVIARPRRSVSRIVSHPSSHPFSPLPSPVAPTNQSLLANSTRASRGSRLAG
jgi:hypothetical protein